MAFSPKFVLLVMVFVTLTACSNAGMYCDDNYDFYCDGQTVCCCQARFSGSCLAFGCCQAALSICCEESKGCCSPEYPVCDVQRKICRKKFAEGGLRGWAWDMFASVPMTPNTPALKASDSSNANIQEVV